MLEEKRNPIFLPFLEVHDQLQTNGISKQFDAQKRDCAQIVDMDKNDQFRSLI